MLVLGPLLQAEDGVSASQGGFGAPPALQNFSFFQGRPQIKQGVSQFDGEASRTFEASPEALCSRPVLRRLRGAFLFGDLRGTLLTIKRAVSKACLDGASRLLIGWVAA